MMISPNRLKNRASNIYTDILKCLKSIFFLTSIAFVLCIWILDPFINAVFLNKGTIYQLLTQQGIHEIVIRSVISVLIIVAGFIGGFLLNRPMKVEKELSKMTTFIQNVFDTDPNFIFIKDRESRFVFVNKATADAYGTTVENLIGKSDSDFNTNEEENTHFHLDDIEVIDTHKDKFISEEAITTSKGELRWLQTIKRPLIDAHGKVNYLLGISTDITDRKQAEEDLIVSHTLYRQAEQMGKLGHWEWNVLTDQLITCSDQYAKIFDMTIEDVMNSPQSFAAEVNEFVHEDDRARYMQEINAAYKLNQGWDIEYSS